MEKIREIYRNMDWLEKQLVHKLLGIIIAIGVILAFIGGLTVASFLTP